jgi:hypothetical protein
MVHHFRYYFFMKILCVAIILFSISSFAAECKFVNKKSANKIYTLLNQYHAFEEIAVIDSYCKECMDDYVKPIVIDKIELKPHTIKGYFTLNINDKPLELTHTYFKGENLGYKVGCDSKFATKYLYQNNRKRRKTSSL